MSTRFMSTDVFSKPLEELFPSFYGLILEEEERIKTCLNLIASENIPSRAVFEAQKSVFSVKYAEGYPGARYYAGCDVVDKIEIRAKELAQQLFRMDHANVQPHSGAQANQAIFETILKEGETIMALSLDHGGHLTHGHKVNFSGKRYNSVFYPVDPENFRIDLNVVEDYAKKYKPKLIIAGASAYSFAIDFDGFREICDRVGSLLLADVSHYSGLIISNLYPSPSQAHFVSTTTHKTLRGPRSGIALCCSEFAKSLDRAVFPYLQGGPHMHTIFAKAVCFEICKTDLFRSYARMVLENAKELARIMQNRGFEVVGGGTDSHMFLVNVSTLGLTGKEAQSILEECGIYVNKNTIPYDKNPPAVASGIRIGTPMITSLGLIIEHMSMVADFFYRGLIKRENPSSIRNDIRNFALNNFSLVF
ncbi:MAG: serine hydroxymethyltransferase [Deltaproteobacteria bacterium]|nr:serine hydroxymethyltransferase [Deltaproteobacteria bacterium]